MKPHRIQVIEFNTNIKSIPLEVTTLIASRCSRLGLHSLRCKFPLVGLPRRRIAAAAAAGDGLVAIIPVMETTSTKSRCAQRTDKGVGGKTIEFLFRGCRHRHLSWLKNRRRKMGFALPDKGWMKKGDGGNII